MKVLKFSASWCVPCKSLANIIESNSNIITVDIENVDIDENFALARQYNIRSVPTLVMIDDVGNELKRNSGALTTEALLNWLK